jgi:hypothetical protein
MTLLWRRSNVRVLQARRYPVVAREASALRRELARKRGARRHSELRENHPARQHSRSELAGEIRC